ncbi:hypothetical protein [Pseudaestuariivita rosea]|uniref:hypothetical protein n=1 Tax=Pseudaestuariivita rosea TaxID=2763263 RepID=UPI001ABA7E83|nr:hypothetical protein [Pseudaestuariivita rosea]
MTSSDFGDALLLYAILYECQHKRVANLRGVFAAMDAINRSAPTLDELNAGLTRLLSAGLIARDNDVFQTTNPGANLRITADKAGDTIFARLEKMAELIGTLTPVPEYSAEISARA